MADRRAFCADVSSEVDEPLQATASRIDHWLLVEYRGLWSYDALAGSGLSDQVKAHLREQVASLPQARLLFIRRPDRRSREGLLVFAASSREREERLVRIEIESYEDVRALDFGAARDAVVSPMQGTVLAVEVSDGDSVTAGQILCVVEAMKMENEVIAHRDGVVTELSVAPGEPVQTGQVICVVAQEGDGGA